jgi:hypothetical protein
MNLKIFMGVLTAGLFTLTSCSTADLTQKNMSAVNTVKPTVPGMSTLENLKKGTVTLRIDRSAFKTKASSNGQIAIDHVLVALVDNTADPLAGNRYSDNGGLNSGWQSVSNANLNTFIVIHDTPDINSAAGTTWYAAIRAYADAGETNEIATVNADLSGGSTGTRIAVSDDAVFVKTSDADDRFFTDDTYVTLLTGAPIINMDLPIDTVGATIGSTLAINDGSATPDAIQAAGSNPVP